MHVVEFPNIMLISTAISIEYEKNYVIFLLYANNITIRNDIQNLNDLK